MRQIRLRLDHTSGGVKYYAGSTIMLPDEEAEWVVQQTGAFYVAQEEAIKAAVMVPKVEDVLK